MNYTSSKKSVNILCPNLRYKKSDNEIYFVAKNPIKLKINGNMEYRKEFKIENISLSCDFYYLNLSFEICIAKKEHNAGVILNIKYPDEYSINSADLQKIARSVEASIIGINLMDDSEIDLNEYDSTYDLYINNIESNNKDINNNKEYVSENNSDEEYYDDNY